MKKLAALPVLLLLPFVVLSWRQTPQAGAATQSLEARVTALETQLAAEKKRGDENRALLDQTLAYLEGQGKNAQTLLGVLTESEAQGFAMGENWKSREILLAGMRAYWTSASAGLPKAPAPPAPEKTAPPTRTRPPKQ